MSFALHEALAADCMPVMKLPLCHVLLMDDRRFPWLILVPERPSLREMFELNGPDRAQLMEEISHAAQALRNLLEADKMNIAMLGNQVPQLHVHVIARFITDAAWPNPVWSSAVPRQRYDETAKAGLIARLDRAISLPF